jgi:hypothetical protein
MNRAIYLREKARNGDHSTHNHNQRHQKKSIEGMEASTTSYTKKSAAQNASLVYEEEVAPRINPLYTTCHRHVCRRICKFFSTMEECC